MFSACPARTPPPRARQICGIHSWRHPVNTVRVTVVTDAACAAARGGRVPAAPSCRKDLVRGGRRKLGRGNGAAALQLVGTAVPIAGQHREVVDIGGGSRARHTLPHVRGAGAPDQDAMKVVRHVAAPSCTPGTSAIVAPARRGGAAQERRAKGRWRYRERSGVVDRGGGRRVGVRARNSQVLSRCSAGRRPGRRNTWPHGSRRRCRTFCLRPHCCSSGSSP